MTSTREETAGCRLPSYALSFSPKLSTSPHSCSPQALAPPPHSSCCLPPLPSSLLPPPISCTMSSRPDWGTLTLKGENCIFTINSMCLVVTDLQAQTKLLQKSGKPYRWKHVSLRNLLLSCRFSLFCQIKCLNLDEMTAGSLSSSIVLLLRGGS